MRKKIVGLAILCCGVLAETSFAKMPFLPPTKIKVEEWKTELKWTDDIVGKIMLAQSNHGNKAKVIKSKQRKETNDFAKLLEQKDPTKNEIDAFVKNMADLEKSQWENDIEFITQIKKALKPDQQKELIAKMSQKRTRSKKEDESE